jgi:tetratricopeptide (TPR) repeat protein
MIRRGGLILAVLVSITANARALDLFSKKQDAGQPGAFLNFASSARSLGIGHAYTAVADDAAAAYWNAAGLSQITRKDLVTLYSALEEQTNYGFFSYAQPSIDYGTFGLSVVNLRSGGFERREAITGNAVGNYEMSETAFLFSHGIRTSGKLAMGSTVKVVRQEIDAHSDMGYGLDLSSLYPLTSRMKVGLVVSNLVAPSLKLQSEKERYPREVRAGVQFMPRNSWMVSTDFVKTENRSMKINLGTEWALNSLVALRAGLTDTEITAGLGVQMGDWSLDYAMGHYQSGPAESGFGASHRFGVHFKFGTDINDSGASLRWATKGQECLWALSQNMQRNTPASDDKLQKLLDETAAVIKNRGYLKAQDLYAAQAYIYYFREEYERSVQSFAEAAALDQNSTLLAQNLEKARAKMTQEDIARSVGQEMVAMQKAFKEGNWRPAIASAKKILSLRPDHIEAAAYLSDAQTRLNEPINRALKIARAKFEREEYLDAIKNLHEVRKLDPENKDAADLMSKAIDALEKGSVVVASGATRQVQEISRDNQKSREAYSKGLRYYSQGKIQDALVAWKDAVRYDEANTSAQKSYERAMLEISSRQ